MQGSAKEGLIRGVQEKLDEERSIGIENATLALIEGGVKEQKIVDLLTKYWNLRPSEEKWYYEEMKNK